MKRRILAAALCSLGAAQSVLAEATDNLLDLAVLQADASAIAATPADIFEALTDGDASTIAPFTSLDGAPVDLLFQFDAQTIPPDSVEWALADGSGSPAPGRIDVMVSNIAPTEGFVSLRLGPIDPLRAKQRMGFQPRAANWVRIRLYPPANSQTFALGDLHLKGALGPPQTRYAFGETPADAIDVISALAGIGSADLQLTEAEAAIFKRAGDNELDSKDFTAIALLASGVVDPQARNAYEQQIEALAERARAKDDPNAPLSQRGSALLDFLHSAALTDGYREGQTDLSTLLDSGVFNCVSSAVLYNAIALRLGMDARAIEVPDHAFSIVYDGLDHMDVETTTPEGFNPARDRVAAFEQLTGFRYIPQSNTAKRREIGTNGLAALIYYNHGVTHLAEGRYQEALFANFRALSLDPDFASAGTNALAALGQWSAALAENGAWEDSTKIAAVAVRLAPDDRGLASNQIAVWQQWATSEVNAGHPAKALEILRAAGTSVDMETFAGIEIAILTRPAETLIAAGDWEAALTQAETLDALMDAQGRNGLESWRKSVFGRWASATIDQGAYAASLAVLARGLADFPDDPRLERAVRYLGQEWAVAEGYETGLAVLTQIETALPNIDQMDDVVLAHVHRHISTGLATTPLDQMLAQVALADVFLNADQSDDLAARVYMAYGAAKIDANQWQDAAKIYAAAVTRFPAHNGLGRNARYVAQEWQRDAGKGDDLAALEAVQNELRALFPAFAVDPEFGEDEIIRQINTLLRDRAFDEAQQKLASAQLLLRPESYRDLQEVIFDQIAQAAMTNGDWENAAMTYAEGQLALADSQLFSRNIRYITQEWTKSSAATIGQLAF